MTRRHVSILGVFILALGLLFLITLHSSVDVEGETIIVDHDGSGDNTTIGEAINYASPGDIIEVHEGTYYECIIINKTLSLIGKDGGQSIIDGGEYGSPVLITAPWVNVTRFTIRGGGDHYEDAAVRVEGHHCNISQNECSNANRTGINVHEADHAIVRENIIPVWSTLAILIEESSNCNITGNDCSDSDKAAIAVISGDDNLITGNDCSSTRGCISIETSSRNTITGNDCSDSEWGIYIGSSDTIEITGNDVTTCNEGGIFLYDSSSCTVSGNDCSHSSGVGIQLDDSSLNTIADNDCQWNGAGIELFGSTQNTISGCWIGNNSDIGIQFGEDADLNTVSGNQITHNGLYAIDMAYCADNSFENNLIIENEEGFQVDSCDGISVHNNEIYNNNWGIGVPSPGEDPVDATENWWGFNSGPNHETTNPDGEGNEVSDHVLYDPWIGKGEPEVNQKPRITNMYPHVGSTHKGSGSRIEIWAEDENGDETIEYVQIAITNDTWNSSWMDMEYNDEPETPRWQYLWDTTTVAEGDYVIESRAYDGEKYSRTQKYDSVTVDQTTTTPPDDDGGGGGWDFQAIYDFLVNTCCSSPVCISMACVVMVYRKKREM